MESKKYNKLENEAKKKQTQIWRTYSWLPVGEGLGRGNTGSEDYSFKKEARIYNGKKTTSLTSGAGKTGQPLVKE